MKQISAIWIGNPYFQSALADRGWRVHWMNPPTGSVVGWDALVNDAGFSPDVVVVGDKSQPPFVTGMESFPCLTTFYAVDSHIHSWFPLYAQGFDTCLVSLKDHLPLFTGMRIPNDMVWWSPPYARPEDTPREQDPEKPLWDVLFVGTVDPAINPERCAFLDAAADRIPGLVVRSGEYQALYPQAKIVLNHTAAHDLNFRVFEALGCGACLVTPFVHHGFDDLFQNGKDLFVFDQNDLETLAKLCRVLIDAPKRREKAAASGHAIILAGHYMRHRAEAFALRIERLFSSGKAGDMVSARIASAKGIRSAWLRLVYLHHAETMENGALGEAYLKAAKG